MQAARALERSDYFREQYRKRVVVEHRNARLAALGMRQARYFGRAKTRLQLLLAAAVANLTLIAGRMAQDGRSASDNQPVPSIFTAQGAARRLIMGLSGALKHLPGLARPLPMRGQLCCASFQ